MAKARAITGLDPQAPTGKNASIIARTRLDEMYEWKNAVDQPYAVKELHNLRIAAKRLRYTLEIFEDYLPRECKAVVKELEQIQEELGQLHDSDVLIALLRLCLGSQELQSPRTLQSPRAGSKKAIPSSRIQARIGYQWNSAKSSGNVQGKKPLLRPELVEVLLDPANAPGPEERYGLEQLMRRQEQIRVEQYRAFRQHWYRLQEQDFRQHVLDLLNKE